MEKNVQKIPKQKKGLTHGKKLALGFISICLLLVVGVMGIFAATSQSAGVVCRVSFSATDVAAKIYVEAYHIQGSTQTPLTVSGLTTETEASSPAYVGMKYFLVTHDKASGAISLPSVTLDLQASTNPITKATVESSCVYYKFTICNIGDRTIVCNVNSSELESANYENLVIKTSVSNTSEILPDYVSMNENADGFVAENCATQAPDGYAGYFELAAHVKDVGFPVPATDIEISMTLTAQV